MEPPNNQGEDFVIVTELEQVRTVHELLASWSGIRDRCHRNAAICAQIKNYTGAAENQWIATGIESCIQDLQQLSDTCAGQFGLSLSATQRAQLLARAGDKDLAAYIKEQLGLNN